MKVRLADPSYDPLPDIAARRKKELIPLLESLIANDRTDRKVRCFAMYVLSEMAGPVELPVPALEVALGSADGQVREFARVAAQELQRRGLEREKRGTLGVVVGEKRDGSLPVKYVTPGGAAARVSIKESDVLLKANGRPLQQMDDLARVLRDAHVGDAVALVIQRGTQQLRRTVILDSQATWENVLPRLWEP
jgi:membrane-associated protease RseP (regulator of RpoE activity)